MDHLRFHELDVVEGYSLSPNVVSVVCETLFSVKNQKLYRQNCKKFELQLKLFLQINFPL